MALILAALAVVYVLANVFVARKTSTDQAAVEQYHNNVYGRVGDVLGNVTVVQSYARFASEMQAMRTIMAELLAAQYPVLTWWGLLTVLTRIGRHHHRGRHLRRGRRAGASAGRSRSARSWPSSASPAC